MLSCYLVLIQIRVFTCSNQILIKKIGPSLECKPREITHFYILSDFQCDIIYRALTRATTIIFHSHPRLRIRLNKKNGVISDHRRNPRRRRRRQRHDNLSVQQRRLALTAGWIHHNKFLLHPHRRRPQTQPQPSHQLYSENPRNPPPAIPHRLLLQRRLPASPASTPVLSSSFFFFITPFPWTLYHYLYSIA